MSGNTIYIVKKGEKERGTLPDIKSAQDLMYALNVLNCYEQVGKRREAENMIRELMQRLEGNRPSNTAAK